MKKRSTGQLAEILRQKYAELGSWPQVSQACHVLTEDGRPNPALAERIAIQGYEPKREETRRRLGLAPICVSCGRRVRVERHAPEELREAVDNLRRLEAAANAPALVRVYGRGGKRAMVGIPRNGQVDK